MHVYDKFIYHNSSGGKSLAHHGVKGQKWGIRRYQNEDGSLTEAGKKRYLNQYGGLNFRANFSKIDQNKFYEFNKKNKTYKNDPKKETKSNNLKQLFYTDSAKKDFLDQMKKDFVGPWMVDDPGFVDLMIDEYIDYEDRSGSLTPQHRDQIFNDYKKMFYNIKRR